ncbi:MAG: AI-2E family transporter [Bacteroidales bacterium]
MNDKRPYTFDRVVRIFIAIIIIVGAFWLINYLKGVLLPFLVACLIAYILQPMVEANKRLLRLKRDMLPVFITLLEVVLMLFIVISFLIPYISSEIQSMILLFEEYAKTRIGGENIKFVPDVVHELIVKYANFDYLQGLFSKNEWIKIIENALKDTFVIMGGGLKVIMAVVGWFVVLLYLVFILIDYNTMANGFKKIIPERFREGVFQVLGDIQSSMDHYFRGQSLIALIVGVLFSIGFLIIGLPMAVLFGLFIGLLNMVPYLQLISIPIAAILCLVSSVGTGGGFWLMLGKAMLVYIVVQAIQDLILTPKVMGKYMGLNPAIIFLSLSIWGTLFGFVGLIIALPLTTLVISYYKRYVIGGNSNSEKDKNTEDSESETKSEE